MIGSTPRSSTPCHGQPRGLLCALLCALFLLLCPAPAGAEPGAAPAPAAGKKKMSPAEAHFWRGEQHYRLGEFAQAREAYLASYKASGKSGLLFNIAQCHRQLREHDRALFYYKLYLSDWRRHRPGVTPPYKKEVQGHIAALAKQVEQDKKAAAAPTVPPARPAPAPASPPAGEDAGEPPAPPRWRAPAGWTLVGVGAASLITGVVFSALAADKADEHEQIKGTALYEEVAEVERQGKAYQAAQIATLVAGGVLAGVGAALLIWHRVEQPEAGQVSLAPAVGPGLLGVTGQLRF